MTGFGYSRAPEKAFIGFHTELNEGAWGSVPLDPQLVAQRPAASSLVNQRADTRWKLRATWAIQDIAAACGSGIEISLQADRNWDSAQRKLHLQTALKQESDDAIIRAAAERVRSALLHGEGTEQTRWSYDKEIDTGRSQVFLASKEPLKSDIQLLDLGAAIAEIATTTEALAAANGRGNQASASTARWARVRDAKAACANAFNAIHDELDWCIANQTPGSERDRLEALRAPLLALLARHPAIAPSDDAPEPPAEPPAA